MKDDEPSIALPIVIIGVFMLAVFAGGFFALRAVQQSRAAAASATPVVPLPPPPPSPSVVPTALGTAPTATAETAPTAHVFGTASPGTVTSTTPVPNAEQAIARLRPGFRSCYNRGLAADPSMSGNLVMSVKIAANGDVIDVTKVSGTGLSNTVEECILRRAKAATFDAPGGSGSSLKVPITFVSAP